MMVKLYEFWTYNYELQECFSLQRFTVSTKARCDHFECFNTLSTVLLTVIVNAFVVSVESRQKTNTAALYPWRQTSLTRRGTGNLNRKMVSSTHTVYGERGRKRGGGVGKCVQLVLNLSAAHKLLMKENNPFQLIFSL